MERVRVLVEHVAAAGGRSAEPSEGGPTPSACAAGVQAVQDPVSKADKVKRFFEVGMEFLQGTERLRNEGVPPSVTAFELRAMQASLQTQAKMSKRIAKEKVAEAEDAGVFALASLLPGPLQHVKSLEEKVELLRHFELSKQEGWNVQLIAEYQLKYGDRGLSSNIIVPTLEFGSDGLVAGGPKVVCQVVVAEPEDAERISRVHVRKDGSFEPILFDGVIATTDNDHWRRQRAHLAEAFLPLSSLARIMPTSLARAKACAERLGQTLATTPGGSVDMSDFLLHEAQAQLQLALLGLPEDFMEATNKNMRMNFMMRPDAPIGKLSEAMAGVMKAAKEDKTLALPSDGGAVRGPLARAIQTSTFGPTTDYGNALLILFAGHDTTGHAMTWLLFELARHPDAMREMQQEVDSFFHSLNGKDPEYRDLARLTFLDCCITEILRLWNSVPNGTFRQLQFDDVVEGAGGQKITLPRGTHVNIVNWSRHRNPALWGADADEFNPRRNFSPEELSRVGGNLAARTPQSPRYSPFAHAPRTCLGRNFAQMEMRLIVSYLVRNFEFRLTPAYEHLRGKVCGATVDSSDPGAFRGVNKATMGPLDLEGSVKMDWGTFYNVGMPMIIHRRE